MENQMNLIAIVAFVLVAFAALALLFAGGLDGVAQFVVSLRP